MVTWCTVVAHVAFPGEGSMFISPLATSSSGAHIAAFSNLLLLVTTLLTQRARGRFARILQADCTGPRRGTTGQPKRARATTTLKSSFHLPPRPRCTGLRKLRAGCFRCSLEGSNLGMTIGMLSRDEEEEEEELSAAAAQSMFPSFLGPTPNSGPNY